MKSKVVFGKWETTNILLNLICTQIIIGYPRMMTERAGTAAWILATYASILALIAFLIIARQFKKFEGKDLIDIAEKGMGSFGRIAVGSIVMAFLLFIISVVLREFAEDMKVISLPTSPVSFVMLFFIAAMIVSVYFGIEAIARINAVMVIIIAVSFVIITIGVAPYYDFRNLFPILGKGANEIFLKGANAVSIYSAIIALFLFTPFLKTYKNFKSVGITSIIFGGIFLVWSVLVYAVIFPYPISKEKFLPVYEIARLFFLGRFFQRVESVFVFMWASSAMLYLSTGFYQILYVFRKMFKLDYFRPLIIPFAILIFNLSLLPENVIAAFKLESGFFRYYAWIVTFVVPFVVLMIASIRAKRLKGRKCIEKN